MTLLTPELAALEGRTVTYTAPEELGRAAIRYFARAVGASDPIHWDVEAARADGHEDVVAPPTMIFETNQYLDVEPDVHGFAGHAWGIEVPDTRLIRGGNAYRFHHPVLASTVPEMTWTIDSVSERSGRDGRSMVIVESTAECRDQRGILLAENTETLIYQELDAAAPLPVGAAGRGPSPRSAGGWDPSPEGEGRKASVVRAITLTDMVRYAGATWDWHQLHYDHEFLRSIGLDRPVVDGQMLGALMADQLETLGRVESLEFRFRSMVFAGEEITLEAEIESVDDGEVSVRQTVKVGDRVCVTGGGVAEVAS